MYVAGSGSDSRISMLIAHQGYQDSSVLRCIVRVSGRGLLSLCNFHHCLSYICQPCALDSAANYAHVLIQAQWQPEVVPGPC